MPKSEVDPEAPATDSTDRCRLIVVGSQVEKYISAPDGLGDEVEVAKYYDSLDDWMSDREPVPADLIIAECPTMFPETTDFITRKVEETKAVRAVVVYHFCPSETEGRMNKRESGITALRAPITPAGLKAACEADLALAAIRSLQIQDMPEAPEMPVPQLVADEIPERQFSDEQIAAFSRVSTSVECECPRHMAELLNALNAFEKYSLECENKNQADSVLHAFLYRRTANARSMMEDALAVLVEAEGIDF